MTVRRLMMLLVAFFFVSEGAAEEQVSVGIVTFTFDDASRSQYENAFRIMRQYDLKGTLFVVSGGADAASSGEEPFYMTWDDIRRMQNAGWEIGAHTHSIPHPDLTMLSDQDLFSELAFSKRRISEEVGIVPRSFATPFGSFDERVLREIRRYYVVHMRAWGGSEGFNTFPVADPFDVGRFDVTYTETSEHVCLLMEQAGKEGLWLVLTFHQVVEEPPSEYQVGLQTFEEIVRCTRQLQDEGHLRVMTTKDVLMTTKGNSL